MTLIEIPIIRSILKLLRVAQEVSPERSRISVDKPTAPADGRSSVTIETHFRDKYGRAAGGKSG